MVESPPALGLLAADCRHLATRMGTMLDRRKVSATALASNREFLFKKSHGRGQDMKKKHDCFHHKKPKKGKGKGRGKPCSSLVKIPVLQDKQKGGEKLV